MMPDPEEVDVELENMESDYDDSPYPVDDRHMLDSIYRNTATDTHLLSEIYKSYRSLKMWFTMFVYALIACLIGLSMVRILA